MSTLSGEGFSSTKAGIEKSMSGVLDGLKLAREEAERILRGSIKDGNRSIVPGFNVEDVMRQAKSQVSLEDFFAKVRSQFEKPVDLPIDVSKEKQSLDEINKRLQLQMDLRDQVIAKIQSQQGLAEGEYSKTRSRIQVSSEEIANVSLQKLQEILPTIEGQSEQAIEKMLRTALTTAFSKAGTFEGLFKQFIDAHTSNEKNAPTIRKLFGLKANDPSSLEITQELRSLFEGTLKGSYMSSSREIEILEKERKEKEQIIQDNDKIIQQNQEIEKSLSPFRDTSNANPIAEAYRNFQQIDQQYSQAKSERKSRLDSNTENYNQTKKSLEELTQQILRGEAATKQYIEASRQNITIQNDVEDTFNRLTYRLKYFFSIFTIYRNISKWVRQTYSDLQNLDKAFGSIAMVTSKTVNDLWGSYSQYADIANRLGQTTESAIKTSALFYQQGLDTTEVLKLTESTMKLATLAGQDFETSTKQLTAALRAFHMEMEQGEHVTDVYSELAAHAAADVSGIADAMSKVASIASSAGASFENISAFLTQIIETTQEGGVNAGTALKTIIARFTELKENVDDTEESFEDLDYNKVDKALKSVGINLKDDVGQIRNFDDIIIELSGIWDTLSRNQQRYIATIAAGSRQQSRFIALLEDHERLMELIEVAENSAGRSTQQFAKYADTIEYKVATLKNTWEQFRISLLNEKTIKKILEGATNGLKRIVNFDWLDWTKAAATFLLLGKTVGTSFLNGFKSTSLLAMQGIGGIINFIPNKILKSSYYSASRDLDYTNLETVTAIKLDKARVLDRHRSAGSPRLADYEYGGFVNLNDNPQLRQDAILRNKNRIEMQAAQYQAYGASAATALMTGFTTALMQDDPVKVFTTTIGTGLIQAFGSSSQIMSIALNQSKSLGIALTQGLTTGGISLLISAVTAGAIALGKWAINAAKAKKENKALESSFYVSQKTIESLKIQQEQQRADLSTLEETAGKSKEVYDNLVEQGDRLEELRSQAALTTEEQQEMYDISNQLVEIYPQLLDRYTSEGNAILNLGDAYKELVAQKKEAMHLDELELRGESALEAVTTLSMDQAELAGQEDLINEINENPYFQLLTGKVNPNELGFVGYFNENPRDIFELAISNLQQNNEFGYGNIALGSMLTKLLEGNPYISDLSKVEPSKVLSEIMRQLDEGGDFAYQSAMKQISEYANTQKKTEEKVRQQGTVLQQRLDSYYSEAALDIPEFEDANAYVQQRMVSAIEANVDIDWEGIQRQAEADAIAAGKKDQEKEEFIYKRTKELYLNALNDVDIAQILAGTDWSLWEGVSKQVTDTSNIRDEYLAVYQAVHDAGLPEEEKNRWITDHEQQIEAENERIERLKKITGEYVGQHTLQGFDVGKIYLPKQGTVTEILSKSTDFADRFIDTYNNLAESSSDAAYLFRRNISNIAKTLEEEDFLTLVNAPWDKFDLVNEDEFWDTIVKELDNPEGLSEEIKETLKKYFTENTIIDDDVLEAVDTKYDELVKTNISSFEKAMTSFIEDGFMDAESLKALRKAGAPIQKFINDDLTPNEDEMTKWITSQINELDALGVKLKEARDLRLSNLDVITKIAGKSWEEVKAEATLLNLNKEDMAFLEKNWSKSAAENANTIAELEKQISNMSSDSAVDDYVASLADATWGALEATLKAIDEKRKKNVEDIEKANKEVEDSYQNLLEKQQDLIDKQKDLNEALYGSSNYKNSLDPLYNYQTAIDTLQESIDELKESLEDLNGQDPSSLLDQLFEKTHAKGAQLTAQNNRYRAAIDSIESMLTNELVQYLGSSGHGFDTNVSSYFAYNALGDFYEVNQDAINSARMSDELKNFISDQVNQMNDYLKSIRSNNKELKKVEQEFKEYQKKVRDDYISIQDEVVEKLKDSYQKEIDDRKEMYDALKEADDDYLDALEKAIDKQRKLRDRQDKWNNLSTKEKRLSLLQRDTSGANRKETQNLRKEIENDRQSLLDESVDDIVDNLKELYETQQESREAEIEYQQSVLDNANLVLEANNIMLSWKSLEDMQEWMAQHTEDFDKMSDATVEKLQEDWATMFDNIQEYNALQQKEVSDIFNFTSQEIQDIVNSTSEVLTSEASRALAETTSKVEESIASAQQAVSSAMDALSEAQTKYNDAITNYNELIGETTLLTAAYRTTLEKEDEDRTHRIEQEMLLAKYQANLDNSRGVSEARDAILNDAYYHLDPEYYQQLSDYKPAHAYASGGLVDYTGPAWVDGTKQKPESFLDAEDTYRIGKAADILRDLALNNSFVQTAVPAAVESNIQITINVDSIATEDQVDYLIDRMKEEIVDSANPIGSSVILR